MNFRDQVYQTTAKIPKGKVATYGQIATLAGFPGAARAVGGALSKNTDPIAVPCHRVVSAGGRFASNYAFGGIAEKRKRLIEEGVSVSEDYTIDLGRFGWDGIADKP